MNTKFRSIVIYSDRIRRIGLKLDRIGSCVFGRFQYGQGSREAAAMVCRQLSDNIRALAGADRTAGYLYGRRRFGSHTHISICNIAIKVSAARNGGIFHDRR